MHISAVQSHLYLRMEHLQRIGDIEGPERRPRLLAGGLPVHVARWTHAYHVHHTLLVHERHITHLQTQTALTFLPITDTNWLTHVHIASTITA